MRPQHFLPVHGEYAFLCAHAELAKQNGVNNLNVVRNGQMVGCAPLRNGQSLGGLKLLGEAHLRLLYNDGNNVRPPHPTPPTPPFPPCDGALVHAQHACMAAQSCDAFSRMGQGRVGRP